MAIVKILVSAVLIALISEISKRSSFLGAILASIPLVSVIAMVWMYEETQNVEKISQLSIGIFWLVIPSLALFVSLPLLLKWGYHFYLALAVSCALTVAAYGIMIVILKQFGIEL